MPQSTLTVTPPNPTPPTNMSFVGMTPPTNASEVPFDDQDGDVGNPLLFQAGWQAATPGNLAFCPPEGTGTEVSATAPGSRAACPTVSMSCLGNFTGVASGGPNSQHPSSSPLSQPLLTSISPATLPAVAGSQLLTCTGANFTAQSVIWLTNSPRTTTFVNATTLTATIAKATSPTTWQVWVITPTPNGGSVITVSKGMVFT